MKGNDSQTKNEPNWILLMLSGIATFTRDLQQEKAIGLIFYKGFSYIKRWFFIFKPVIEIHCWLKRVLVLVAALDVKSHFTLPASWCIPTIKITFVWWIDSRDCKCCAVDSHFEFQFTIPPNWSGINDHVRLWKLLDCSVYSVAWKEYKPHFCCGRRCCRRTETSTVLFPKMKDIRKSISQVSRGIEIEWKQLFLL